MRASLLVSLVCAAACCGAFAAPPPDDLGALADHASLVVVAECTALRSEWNAQKTLIVTTAEHRVERVIKGSHAGGVLRVEQVGGTVGRITQTLVGAPGFRVGERSLLFLTPERTTGALQIYGLGRGKHEVLRDPATGKDRVVLEGSLDAAAAAFREGPAARRAEGAALHGAVSLDVVAKAIASRGKGAR